MANKMEFFVGGGGGAATASKESDTSLNYTDRTGRVGRKKNGHDLISVQCQATDHSDTDDRN